MLLLKKIWRHFSPYHLALLLIIGVLIKQIIGYVFSISQFSTNIDPDVFLRLSIVRDLWHSGEWQNHFISRLGAPFGVETPWTRPLDVLISIFALPFLLFFPIDTSLFATGFLMNAILQVACVFLILKTIRQTGESEKIGYSVVLAFLFSPMINNYMMPAFADHHALLITATVFVFYLSSRLIQEEEEKIYKRKALLLGGILGFGIWVSPEFLVVAAVITGWLGLEWCINGERKWINNLFTVCFSALAVITLGIFTEHGSERWLEIAYDTLSVVHIATMGGIALLALILSGVSAQTNNKVKRFMLAVLGGIILLAVWHYCFPRFFYGPAAGVSPEMKKAFLDNVKEMQSPLSMGIFFLLGVEFLSITGCIVLLWLLWKKKQNANSYIRLLLISNIFLGVLGIGAIRLDYYPGVAGVFLITHVAYLLSRHNLWSGLTKQPQRFVLIALMPAYLCLMQGFMDGNETYILMNQECSKELREWVEENKLQEVLKKKSEILITSQNDGAYILWKTPYSVIASNYHRNEAGYLAQEHIMDAKNEETLVPLLKKWQVSAMLFCERKSEKRHLQTLIETKKPVWLVPVVVSGEPKEHIRLYRIDKTLLNNAIVK